MDLDTSRRGPISSYERDRRIKNSLCLFCGVSGHRIATCPKKRQQSLNAMTKEKKKTSGNGNGQLA
jgi:hypothetical protein